MADPKLVDDLCGELAAVKVLDPHSHIDPHAPASTSLDDILGYHYYTELAHSAGVPAAKLGEGVDPRERCRTILTALADYRETTQAGWLVDIASRYLGFTGRHVTPADADALFDAAKAKMAAPDWESTVVADANLTGVVLTNEFDDTLTGFDASFYVPCLRTDTLVFQLAEESVRARLARVTGVEVGDAATLRSALEALFARFVAAGARACAISLPADFTPTAVTDAEWDAAFRTGDSPTLARGTFWRIAEACAEAKLPFDLMIGVTRNVYPAGVHQGRDLFDGRTSLIQYRDLFNHFAAVDFPVSVLTSGQNQELLSYSWIFPNVKPFGHWWYSNVPPYIVRDLSERLSAVPASKLLGYYSDAYKLEFVAPKYAMYRRCLARVLASDFVEPKRLTEAEAVELGTKLLAGNVREQFRC